MPEDQPPLDDRLCWLECHAQPAVAAGTEFLAEDRRQDGGRHAAEEDDRPDGYEDGEEQIVHVDGRLLVALSARLQFLRIAFQHHHHVVDGFGNAAGEIAGAERRHHVVFDDQLGVQVGQRAFQPIADLDAHLAVVRRHQKQHAVVFLGLAELPEAEQPVGVRLDLLAVEAGDGGDDDLVGAFCLEVGEFLGERGFGACIDDAGIVDDAAGQRREIGGEGGEGEEEKRASQDAEEGAPSTPLWPAGHLPRKGGDWLSLPRSPICTVERLAKVAKLLISPLAGEMSGRTEGGVKERKARKDQAHQPSYHPPCFVPKSTFGGCILSSSTVKLAKGSLLRNQKVAHSTEGKVFSVRL